MNKITVLQIIFLIVEVCAAVPLTVAVFGDMNSDVLSASAIVILVGTVGNAVCAVIRAVQGLKKK